MDSSSKRIFSLGLLTKLLDFMENENRNNLSAVQRKIYHHYDLSFAFEISKKREEKKIQRKDETQNA